MRVGLLLKTLGPGGPAAAAVVIGQPLISVEEKQMSLGGQVLGATAPSPRKPDQDPRRQNIRAKREGRSSAVVRPKR